MAKGRKQKCHYCGEIYQSVASLYNHLEMKPPKGVVPTSSKRSFSDRVKDHLSDKVIEVLYLSEVTVAEWLVNHYKQGPNTVNQSPVLYEEELFASQSQFYKKVKSHFKHPASERCFQEKCSSLRKERNIKHKDLLIIKDECELLELLTLKKSKEIVIRVIDSEHFDDSVTYRQSDALKLLSAFSEQSLCTSIQFNNSVKKHYQLTGQNDLCLHINENTLIKLSRIPSSQFWKTYHYELEVEGVVYNKPKDAYRAIINSGLYDIVCPLKIFTNRLQKNYKRFIDNGKLESGMPMRVNTEALVSWYTSAIKNTDLCFCYRFIGKELVFDDGMWKRPTYVGVSSLTEADRWNQYIAEIREVKRGKKKGRPVINFLRDNYGFDAVNIVIEHGNDHRVTRDQANIWEKEEELKQRYDKTILNLNATGGGGSTDREKFTDEKMHKMWELFFTCREKVGMRGQGADVIYRFKEMIANGYTASFLSMQPDVLWADVNEQYEYWVRLKDCLLKLTTMAEKANLCVEDHPLVNAIFMGIEFDTALPKDQRWFVHWQCEDCTKRLGKEDCPVIHRTRWSYLRSRDKGCKYCKGVKQSIRQRMPKEEVERRFQAVGFWLSPEQLTKHQNKTSRLIARVNCDCTNESADWRLTCVDKLGKNPKQCKHCKQYGKLPDEISQAKKVIPEF